MKFASLLTIVLLTACSGRLDLGSTGDGKPPPSQAVPSPTSPTPTVKPAACTPAGITPKKIVELAGFRAGPMAIDGETLYFGASEVSSDAPKGSIWSAPATGGTAERVVQSDYVGGPIGVRGDDLVFMRAVVKGAGGSYTIEYPSVALQKKNGSAVVTLPNPRNLAYVDSLLVHESGIYWGARAYDAQTPRALSRHNGATAELTTLRNFSDTVTDGSEIFYFRIDGNTRSLEAVSSSGGAARTMRMATDGQTRTYAVIGADAGEIFFSSSELIGGGTVGYGDLRAIKKDGSGERTIASGYRAAGRTVLDTTHIYWPDQDDQTVLKRATKTGGAAETFTQAAATQYVSAIATDACNVYYASAQTPATIYAISK